MQKDGTMMHTTYINQVNISEMVARQREYYQSGRTYGASERRTYLKALLDAIKRYEPKIIEALRHDLNKGEFEAYTTEIGILYEEIRFSMKRIGRWMRPKRVKTSRIHLGAKSWMVPEPYGTVLIVAPWNYPFQLAISPLIGAIAAGNTAILKPSELTPHVSALLAQLIGETFAPEHISVIEGGVETSTELLQQKFDYIFFTGSVAVGKVVMEAAAKQLIPVTLELGGKSPCIVHHDANIELAAKRIAFGKFTNVGQTCVAPDYLFVHTSVKDKLLAALRQTIEAFYGGEPLHHPDYGRIVSRRHFERLVEFLHDGTIVTGGQTDAEKLQIAPTILEGVQWESAVMQEEIFGPVLPVLTYDTIEEVITAVNARPKPLALYLFTRDSNVEGQIVKRISYGGGCINDTLMHVASPYLPFGGVGESGVGSYHGKSSFDAFTHYKSILKQTNLFDFSFRYPSSKIGLSLIRKLLK